jgi:hypothetical protein
MKNRIPMRIDDYCHGYYCSGVDRDIVITVLRSISEIIHVDCSLMRPDDELEGDYGQLLDFGDTMTDHIEENVKDHVLLRYHVLIENDSDWRTVDDVILSVARQIEHKIHE